jgi:urea-proton symporter
MLTIQEALTLIVCYGSLLFLSVFYVHWKKGTHSATFLIADRNVSAFQGSLSIAASWIWAPAVFISSQKAYEHGIAGVFWFTVPNIVCFFIFAPFAVRLRKLIPNGYSFPDYIHFRYNNKLLHLTSLFVYLGYQLGAIIINSTAGGILISLLTGLPFYYSVLLTSGIALSYTLISGLRASILTDVIQMILILVIGFIIVPTIIKEAGGINIITNHLGGVSGQFGDVFNPVVAFGFGIATTIGLISGPFADQVFYQRTFAVKTKAIVKTFVLGGLIFGFVPVLLSFLGFIGAGTPDVIAEINKNPEVNTQMVGPITIAHYLPKWALMGFAILALGGLSSTLDSCFCGISSLVTIDIYKRYINPTVPMKKLLKIGRISMLVMALLGICVALFHPKLVWVFLIYGALASSAFFPAILGIYWKRLSAKGAFYAIVLSIILGTPLSIYANVKENANLIVLSACSSVGVGLITCLIFGFLNKTEDNFNRIKQHNEALELV